MKSLDGNYLRSLNSRVERAATALDGAVAEAILDEIAQVEAQCVAPWYGTRVASMAYRLHRDTCGRRGGNGGSNCWQGNLRRAPFGSRGGLLFGNAFALAAVNKKTRTHPAWADPGDAERALSAAHRAFRLENPDGLNGQARIDRWRLSLDDGELEELRPLGG